MSERKTRKLEEIVTRFIDYRGKTPTKTDSGVPLITAKIVKDGGLSPYTEYIADGSYYDWMTRGIPEKNDVIITTEAPLGEVALMPEGQVALAQRIIVMHTNPEECDSIYLKYFLQWEVGKQCVLNKQSGSTVFGIRSAELKKAQVTIHANTDEQKRIAFLLHTIDEKIALNRRLNDNLEAMAQAIYDYWFVQFDFPDENGKPYKSSGGKMVWNEVLKREIPEGWTTETVGEITMCHDSRRIPLSGKERESMQGDIPYYGATGIFGYVNRHIFDGDFVLLAEDGSVMNDKGRPIVQRVSGKVWINNHAHVLQPIKEHGCKLLMMILSEIPVEKIKTGSIQAKINQANLNAYNLVKIPRFLISRMNKILDEIDSRILAIAREISTLTKQRDFLLPLLMNGQVQVKPQGVNYHLTAD